MARSSSIYLVFEAQRVIAAFTVKHELISFLKSVSSPEAYDVIQLKDGVGGSRFNDLTRTRALLSQPVKLPISELVA